MQTRPIPTSDASLSIRTKRAGSIRTAGRNAFAEFNFPSNEAQAATGFCSTVSVNEPGHQGVEVRGLEGLSALDYCRLAEECFVLAAVGKNPEVAAELVKAGDEYLRYATSPTDGQDKQSAM